MDRWSQAIRLREEWLGYGLSTAPADRSTAEAAITELYRLIGRKPPGFVWVDSPAQAIARLPPDGGPVSLRSDRIDRQAPWYVTHQLADLAHRLRQAVDGRAEELNRWVNRRLVSTLPPAEALAAGAGLRDVIEVGVRDALERSVRDGLREPLRLALGGSRLCWYGQHDVPWIGYLDIHRRLGLTRYTTEQSHHLDVYAAIARSCGWWWSYDGYCVVSGRPSVMHHEAVPGALYGERRAHHAYGPAIGYRDGWGGYAWHGRPVPGWVVTDPSVERIATEYNIEVRRCAIERLGWEVYIDRSGFSLVASAPDPGNPGCELHLYDLAGAVWRRDSRVLLAVNGSVERDGHRRRYGLIVPGTFTDPVAAAAWSYGLRADQYVLLQRRT